MQNRPGARTGGGVMASHQVIFGVILELIS